MEGNGETGAEDKKEEYLRKKKELKNDLITLYRQQYNTLPLSSRFEEYDTPLLDFNVTPNIYKVEVQRSLGCVKENISKLTTFREVFYNRNRVYREICIEADAGVGKTAFSKRLVLTWCQASNCIEDDIERFKEPEIATMAQFEFVFMLSLRDCSEECDIDKMIKQQIVSRLANKSNIIETVLQIEKCLVILDGLDDWIHPTSQCNLLQIGIPHRKVRMHCTILTTTRPWKLDVINLKSWKIDQKFKLEGLNKKSASLIPVEILRMDKKSIELYKSALSDGKEAVHAIRVMVVGHYGVGKTTLTKRLFGEKVDINKRESTNGIDVHVRRCKVSMDTGAWNIIDKDQNVAPASIRLVKLLKGSTFDKNKRKMKISEKGADIDKGEDTGIKTKEQLKTESETTNETAG